MDLRPYQFDVANRCFQAWDSGHKNVCLVLPTGGGKTHTKTWIAQQMNKRTMCIAHRQELVLQISESLASFGIYHRIIAPDAVVGFCSSRHIKLFNSSYVDMQADFCVAGVQTLVRRADKYTNLMRNIQLWDIDECFPAGTLVDGKPIETLKIGDAVTAFNERTGNHEPRRITAVMENPMPKHMVRLRYGTHHILTCTAGHPIWTKRGWIEAGYLNDGDEVLHVRVGTNDAKQPHAQGRTARKDASDVAGYGSRATDTGRQRSASDGCGKGSAGNVGTDGLQPSGDCPDGRIKSHESGTTGTGPAQGCVSTWMRVDSVSFLEPDDPVFTGDGLVYNIEVDGLHTYVADGLTVHNCHHVLPANQWGRAVEMFPNAIGLGVTATPLRCDRKPLDATFDSLIVGPTMRDLINQGHLSEYRIFCPPQSIRRDQIKVSSSSGEFVKKDLIEHVHGSHIVGDVVQQYLRIAPGKRGLTFCVDVETADLTAQAYRAAGVPAQLVTGKTPDAERAQYLDQLASGELLQLVNVDLFGEGMDCPALEVVSMARPTMSYGLFCQQFGRALRVMSGKTHATIIDHVGNVIEHGLPDAPREWSLAGHVRSVKSDSDAIPLRACSNCMQPYRRHQTQCPHCGALPVVAGRTAPELVDGDLEELDPTVLARMRGDVIPLTGDPSIPLGATGAVLGRKMREHKELLAEQMRLRQSIAFLAGAWKYGDGMSDREINKRFWLTFGTTVPEAMALRRADAVKLSERIEGVLI